MNILKSIFISTYLMAMMGVSAYAGWMLYQGESQLAWGGVLLASAPMLMMINTLMLLKNIPRTSAHFPIINLIGLIGVGLTGWAWFDQNTGEITLIFSVGSWLSFLAYAYWYSSFGGRESNAKLFVGAPLPAFTLRDTNDKLVTSAQLIDKPSILIFYRGNWCPLCMAQLKELVARYKEITDLGVRVAMISPQPHNNTLEIAKKFNVKFDFLTDEGNAAARALGIENVN
ncbi:MAG: peroxiredoxin-like family protein [Gallionellaceae bacterium]